MIRSEPTFATAFPAVRFAAMTGAVELAVAEAVTGGASRPATVTAVLAAVLAEVAGQPAERPLLRGLCSAGREWLLQRAALRFFGNAEWFEAPCTACGARFDLQLSLRAAPRKEPGPGFPLASVETSLGRRDFFVPNGAHEEAMAGGLPHDRDPRRAFAALCGRSERAVAEAGDFTEADLAAIDAALEAVAPDVAERVDGICPDCGAATVTRIDPLDFAFPRLSDLLAQVHLLATQYHWSEAAILTMPSARRQAYARLISGEARDARGRRRAGG